MNFRLFRTFAGTEHTSLPRFPSPLSLVLVIPALIKLFLLRPDQAFEVHDMAVEWIASGEFKYNHLDVWNHTFQLPEYTAVVALLYLIGLGKTAVLMLQLICGTAAAFLAYRTALVVLEGKPYGRSLGLWLAACVGLSPFLAYYQVRMLHPFAWDMFLALALFHTAWVTRTDRAAPLIGLFALAGLALLDRPTLVLFLLPFLWRQRSYLRSRSELMLKSVLVLLLVGPLGLWVVRNHAITGRYEITSVTDQMIWMGLQKATEGSGQMPNGETYAALLSVPERRYLSSTDPAGQSAFFRSKWKAEVTADPGLRSLMFAQKLKNFWLFRTNAGNGHAIAGMGLATGAFKVYATLVLLLVLLAAWSRDRSLLLVLVTVLLLSIVQCMFYFETRHRLLAEPLLLLMALVPVAEILARWSATRRGRKVQVEPEGHS